MIWAWLRRFIAIGLQWPGIVEKSKASRRELLTAPVRHDRYCRAGYIGPSGLPFVDCDCDGPRS